MRSGVVRLVYSAVVVAVLVAASGISFPSSSADAKAPSDMATAERLVADASQAQLAGDAARYFSLLRQAVRIAPDYELARWQLGQLKVDGEWLAIEEAQRRAAANPKRTTYVELRKNYGDTPIGQLKLARWCRKHRFKDEERFHWASVLSIDPSNEEAQRALGVRWHDGQLLSFEQIETAKQQSRKARRAFNEWSSRIAKWERALESDDVESSEAALGEIRAIRQPEAIAAFEAYTLNGVASDNDAKRQQQITSAFLSALGEMSRHAATESLVRHAVIAPGAEIRQAATEMLRYRKLHDFVPLLLENMMPHVESWFSIATGPDGSTHYRHTLYREGTKAIQRLNVTRSAQHHDRRAPVLIARADGTFYNGGLQESDAEVAVKISTIAHRSQRQFSSQAWNIEQAVAEQNRVASFTNERITHVLANVTGENLGNDPSAWANWWDDYNEYYSSGETPRYEQNYIENRHYYYREPTALRERQMSCFAKGTPVWTKTGQVPVEDIELGDLVLSQDVDTGELTYQPVIGRTVRPPSNILKLSLAREELRTTLGHPFWIAGVGWRMAKELEDGARLGGVTGVATIENVAEDGEEEAYNLVIAEFNTYFVGESGVLVHDNTPRRPTRAIIPGVARN